MTARKLWKVEQPGWRGINDSRAVARPESKVKAYDIYVANARASYEATGRNPLLRFVLVHVDERDDRGWQLYERIDLADGEETA